jgi:hypothetical protein
VLKIHETFGNGEIAEASYLKMEDGELCLMLPASEVVIPISIVVRTFERFGKALDPDIGLNAETSLEIGEGMTVYALRHLARFDVIAKDYLVLAREGQEPLAELAVSIYGALVHLTRDAR